MRKSLLPKYLERIGVTKKPGHIDQDIIEQRFDFFRILAEILQVTLQVFDLSQKHAPCDPALDGAGLIKAEIDTADVAQQYEDLLERLVCNNGRGSFSLVVRSKNMNVLGDALQFTRDQFGR